MCHFPGRLQGRDDPKGVWLKVPWAVTLVSSGLQGPTPCLQALAQLVKNLLANAETTKDVGSIPESERFPGIGNGTHSSILAWRIPWMEEPGRPQSMGSQRVGLNCTTNTFTFITFHMRKRWAGILQIEKQWQDHDHGPRLYMKLFLSNPL